MKKGDKKSPKKGPTKPDPNVPGHLAKGASIQPVIIKHDMT